MGEKALRPPGQQLAATPPRSGKICTAVPRLERHSRCTASYPAVYHAIRKRKRSGRSGKEKVGLLRWRKKKTL